MLTDIDVFVVVKKRIIDGLHHSINRYADTNKEYVNYYNINKYLQY